MTRAVGSEGGRREPSGSRLPHISRRTFLAGAAGTAVALTLPTPSEAALFGKPGRTLFGSYVEPRSGETTFEAIRRFENLINRKVGASRHYLKWHNRFPNDAARLSAAGGRVPAISWEMAPTVTWGSVYRGEHDAYIREQARNLREWGKPVILTVEHEPEYWLANVGPPYTGANFRRAFDHVVRTMRAVGVPNVRFAVVLQGTTYHGGHGGVGDWMPSAHDLVGSDGYNRHRNEWESFASIFAPAHKRAAAQRKPLYIQEYGCQDDRRKAEWFRNAAATIRNWGNVAAVLYSHSTAEFRGAKLDFRVNSRRESLRAYRKIAHSAYFGG